MLEIRKWEDIEKIEDEEIKKYMLQTKKRAMEQQKPWDFENWGYWIILENWEKLEEPIKGTHFSIPTLKQGLLNQLELFEENLNVCEMVYLVDTDFCVSLVIRTSAIPRDTLKSLQNYSLSTV